MKVSRAIVWFRNDLRLHDHPALDAALQAAEQVIPVYCIDPRHFLQTRDFGFDKTGAFRARFLRESLEALRTRLQKCGSDVWIRYGKPEEVIPQLAKEWDVGLVCGHEEVTSEELFVEDALKKNLQTLGCKLDMHWTATLYHVDDLPFHVRDLPDIFTQFRKAVEKQSDIRACIPTPAHIPSPAISEAGEIPTLQALGVSGSGEVDPRSVLPFYGGEVAAIERLQSYIWEGDHLKTYKETRNELLGADYSSKFSAWLALGCISPRYIYEEVKRYESLRVKNSSTYWLIFELIWRDFFRFVADKHGIDLFQAGGIKQAQKTTSRRDQKLFSAWAEGRTGIPFIDANMRELRNTGFMSNRGRQNVASFLVHDLGLDWRMGAEWFESLLVDYDVCSNWGNWNYVAGVGNDPREGRYFQVVGQGKRYDAHAAYIKHWLPELGALSAAQAHAPHQAPKDMLKQAGVSLGGNYPFPVVQFRKPQK